MIPSLFSFLALNVGGWMADTMIRNGMDVTRVRKTMQTIGFGGSAAILATVGYVESVPLAIAMMSLGNIFGGAMSGGLGVNHLDIAPRVLHLITRERADYTPRNLRHLTSKSDFDRSRR